MTNCIIARSVGKNGRNDYSDVLKVQNRLNEFIDARTLDLLRLDPDGDCGKLTTAAICLFQELYLNHKHPDGRIDVGGPTLDKLNGPIDVERPGDVNDILARSIATTLRHASCMHFTVDGITFLPGNFAKLAEYFEKKRLRAIYSPAHGVNAEYFHKNTSDYKGCLFAGFQKASSAVERSIVIHECVHAYCDSIGRNMMVDVAEAIAHFAQTLYYFDATGSSYPATGNSNTNALLTKCFAAVKQLWLDGRRTVKPNEFETLRKAAQSLSNGYFAYDGT
ncbi:MAG: hypothetical protein KDB22_23575 [Planctomycetales bacterium]|nr:hypothetical protein [Planctomycetales bacterium]